MAISLRLDKDTERKIAAFAKSQGKSKSVLLRTLISDFIKKETKRPSPWELGKDVFGRKGSGRKNTSVNRKTILKEKLRAKKNCR